MKLRERFVRRMPEGHILEMDAQEWELVRKVACEGIAQAWRRERPAGVDDVHLLEKKDSIIFFDVTEGVSHFLNKLVTYADNTEDQVKFLAVELGGDLPDSIVQKTVEERIDNATQALALVDNIIENERVVSTCACK